MFDHFIAETNDPQRSSGRKSCNLAIPIRVPKGYSLLIASSDYRGFVNIPGGDNLKLRTSYFFTGKHDVSFDHVFEGPISENYRVNDQTVPEKPQVWSTCREDVQLNAEITLEFERGTFPGDPRAFERPPSGGDMMGTVDTMDSGAGIVYGISLRRCNGVEEIPLPETPKPSKSML